MDVQFFSSILFPVVVVLLFCARELDRRHCNSDTTCILVSWRPRFVLDHNFISHTIFNKYFKQMVNVRVVLERSQSVSRGKNAYQIFFFDLRDR